MKPSETIPIKPYRTIPIQECGEALVPIPKGVFAFYDPHPYAVAAKYFSKVSPWLVRKSVLEAMERAQIKLQKQRPGWKILLHNTYRPNAVQAFMVEHEFRLLAKEAGLDPDKLSPQDRESLAPKVFRIWGIPSEDPATPPLHSTGGAVDCTFADETGREVDMGGAIDENSDRSNPDYYANATDEAGRHYQALRELLYNLMHAEGFHQIHHEWWHFDLGDQYWALMERETGRNPDAVALYGRADLV